MPDATRWAGAGPRRAATAIMSPPFRPSALARWVGSVAFAAAAVAAPGLAQSGRTPATTQERSCRCSLPAAGTAPDSAAGTAATRRGGGWWWLLGGFGLFALGDDEGGLGPRMPGWLAVEEAPVARSLEVAVAAPAVGRPTSPTGAGEVATVVPWPVLPSDGGRDGANPGAEPVGGPADAQRSFEARQRESVLRPLAAVGALEVVACGMALAYQRRRRRVRRGPVVRGAARAAVGSRTGRAPAFARAVSTLRAAAPRARPRAAARPAPEPARRVRRPAAPRPSAPIDCAPVDPPGGTR